MLTARKALPAMVIALAVFATGATAGDELARAEQIVGARCCLCHGGDGEALSPVFPRLAGQHGDYITKQLADFQSGKRRSETMKSQVAELTREDMRALGRYFESKAAPAQAAGDADLIAVGRYVYQHGDRFSAVPGCVTCHGAKAHGTPLLPRLAGQHPAYIEEQLRQFNQRERTNDNAVMHSIAAKLTPLEMHAVAHYVATLE